MSSKAPQTASGRVTRPWISLLPATCGGALVACLTLTTQVAHGQSSVTISGDPPPLIIGTAIAGGEPVPAADGSTVYTVTAANGEKITAWIDEPLPAGVTLELSLTAPTGAVSVGTVVLTTTPQDMVRSIPAGTHSGLMVRYTLRTSVAAGVVSPRWRVITFAVTAGP